MSSQPLIVLVPDSLYDEFNPPACALAPTVELRPYREEGGAVPGLEDAVGVLRWFAGNRFARLVGEGPHIRWLHTDSAGLDQVLRPEVRTKPGLVVTDSGPAFEIAIAEFVLAWMLLVARRLPDLMAAQREHRWQPVEQQELSGQTAGIIGLGPIGRGIAGRANAFGMRTLGLRRSHSPVMGVDETLTGPEGLERLLTASDYVVLAAALTGETKALIGPDQLARMKPTAWLINIARGGLVEETALLRALEEGRIGGACLDVFTQEPLPAESPLWDLPNVHLAPHSSAYTTRLHERQKAIFLENLRRFALGMPLENRVDIGRGY